MFVIVALQTKCGGFASLRMNCNRKSRSLRDDKQRGKRKRNGKKRGQSELGSLRCVNRGRGFGRCSDRWRTLHRRWNRSLFVERWRQDRRRDPRGTWRRGLG